MNLSVIREVKGELSEAVDGLIAEDDCKVEGVDCEKTCRRARLRDAPKEARRKEEADMTRWLLLPVSILILNLKMDCYIMKMNSSLFFLAFSGFIISTLIQAHRFVFLLDK